MHMAAVSEGVRVRLPINNGCYEKWNSHKVCWLSSPDDNPFIAYAKLPLGWRVRNDDASTQCNLFTILDVDGRPVAQVNILSAQSGSAKFFLPVPVPPEQALETQNVYMRLLTAVRLYLCPFT